MKKIKFRINGEEKSTTVDPNTKLLWFIRDELGLTGTKYSCGKSICGTCTVLVDGRAVKSCSTTVQQINGKDILTIEGLSESANLNLQKAWIEEDVSQCGYCQPGQIMQAFELLSNNPDPSDEDIDKSMNKVLCRCGTYNRIRKAIHHAVEGLK